MTPSPKRPPIFVPLPKGSDVIDIGAVHREKERAAHYARWEKVRREQRPTEPWWREMWRKV